MLRVRAVHSTYKSNTCHEVTLLCDDKRLVDQHCKCPAGTRAFPCSHVAAVLAALSLRQGATKFTRGKWSWEEYDAHDAYPLEQWLRMCFNLHSPFFFNKHIFTFFVQIIWYTKSLKLKFKNNWLFLVCYFVVPMMKQLYKCLCTPLYFWCNTK